jgi:4-amino-4-deoxy-L-arabinose transferase-like glycosyltransferase
MTENDQRNRSDPSTRWLAVIVGISIVLRVAVSIYLGDRVVDLPGTADQISYHTLAQRVLAGVGFSFPKEWWPVTAANAPTAHWSYLYTFYLVAVYRLFGAHPLAARLIQAVLVGIFHPWIVYKLGRHLLGSAVGLVGAGLTALYTYFIYYAGTLMTEPFYILAILAGLYLVVLIADRRSEQELKKPGKRLYGLAVQLGLTLGAAILLRQLILLLIPFYFLWILWVGGRRRVLPLLISSMVIVILILPFTWFNISRFHRFVLLNTNAGYAFYMSNHPIYGNTFIPILPSETYIRLIPPEIRHLDEAALDQELLKEGMKFITDDPQRYALLSISRIPAYFMFWPTTASGLLSNLSRVFSFGLSLPFMLYGLILLFIRQKKSIKEWTISPFFILILFIIIYSVIHILSWALIRYRLPVDAVLLIFAGYAAVDLYERYLSYRRSSSKVGFRKIAKLSE